MMQPDHSPSSHDGTPGEVFRAFLRLGLTSFGGPIAHLGYFRDELVTRRRWLSDAAYAELVALCQFLPGPASSQVGFALGYLRSGVAGAVLAWAAFTLPSVVVLLVFASAADSMGGASGQHVIHGLKLVAVAIVAQAVWGMARTLAPDRARAAIAVAAITVMAVLPSAVGQVVAIAVGAAVGVFACRSIDGGTAESLPVQISRRRGTVLIVLFLLFLIGTPVVLGVWPSQLLALFEAFYRAGALVFGGGHVVLPLLEARVVEMGWVSADAFLAGYGATQAVPGPLFTFAAYLGAIATPGPGGMVGAAVALFGIFLPGLLLLMGVLPFWRSLRDNPLARAGMAGANAAVVGLLGTALFHPLWTHAVLSPMDFAVASAGFVLLTVWKLPPWSVVVVVVVMTVVSSPMTS